MRDAQCVMRNAGLALKTFGTKIEGLRYEQKKDHTIKGFLENYSVNKPMCHSFYLIHVITRSHSPLAPGSPKIEATFQPKSRILEQLKIDFTLFLGKYYYFCSLDIMNYKKRIIFWLSIR